MEEKCENYWKLLFGKHILGFLDTNKWLFRTLDAHIVPPCNLEYLLTELLKIYSS